jgi:SAM-dependent methyltransferase
MSAVGVDTRARVRELILESLAAPYTSRSGTDGTLTGNHYQSVRLDGEPTGGFRTNREEILDRVDFRGRKVLDLGANLGEMSRSARARGARLVQGLEYDPFFVEIAQLVTAYNGISRVSFQQADITDPAAYEERYDIVLALSVYHYLRQALDPLARCTDVLVLETHKLDGNLDRTYLGPIQERFPYMRILGETDFGWTDAGKARCVIAFAKTREQLDDVLVERGEWQRPPVPRGRPAERVRVKPYRFTPLDRFFAMWSYATPDALVEAIRRVDVPIDVLLPNRDLEGFGYNGWGYWFLYLRGWLEYRDAGELTDENPYLHYLARHFVPNGPDPVLSGAIDDASAAREVVLRRFADLDRIAAQPEDVVMDTITPMRVVVAPRTPRVSLGIETVHGRLIAAWRVDGWHRAFGARLFGLRGVHAHVEYEPPFVATMKGQVDALEIRDGRLAVSGWCLTDAPVDAVEIRVRGDRLGVVAPIERADVALAFPDVAHAAQSGFSFDAPLPGWWKDEHEAFELVALREWMPVGRLRFDYSPGMFDGPFPPKKVAQRADGHAHPGRLALRAAVAAHELIEAVDRYRAAQTFTSVLHWDAGSALLARTAAALLPSAELVSGSTDAGAVAWASEADIPGTVVQLPAMPQTPLQDDAFDLVLRDRALVAFDLEQLDAWLAEIRRVLRPGGYLTAVGGWPAVVRDAALDVCERHFDVVAMRYLAGHAGGELVVLRRP